MAPDTARIWGNAPTGQKTAAQEPGGAASFLQMLLANQCASTV
jgi:hypothetical protein